MCKEERIPCSRTVEADGTLSEQVTGQNEVAAGDMQIYFRGFGDQKWPRLFIIDIANQRARDGGLSRQTGEQDG